MAFLKRRKSKDGFRFYVCYRSDGYEYRFSVGKGATEEYALGICRRVERELTMGLVEARRFDIRERFADLSWSGDHTIYFARCGSLVKIGITRRNADERVMNLQTGSPTKIELVATIPGTPAEERALHAKFSDFRVSGEWFRECQDIEDLIWYASVTASGTA